MELERDNDTAAGVREAAELMLEELAAKDAMSRALAKLSRPQGLGRRRRGRDEGYERAPGQGFRRSNGFGW